MSSRFRNNGCSVVLALLLCACQREDRSASSQPTSTENQNLTLSTLYAGGGHPPPNDPAHAEYEHNAHHLSQGQKLYVWFNCVGCHANGGGGSGPALMDDIWIYGGGIENIVATIREGRPNGMPSFRGKIPDDHIWEIAGYVRSMSGNVPSDAAPSRNDDMHPGPAENRRPKSPPVQGGTIPQ